MIFKNHRVGYDFEDLEGKKHKDLMATMPIKQDFRLLLCSSLLRCTENNSTLISNCLLTNTVPFLTPLVQLDPTLLTQVEGRGARGCGQQCVKQAVQEGQTRDPELSEENG